MRSPTILRALRGENISCRHWDSGLAISQFRDNSTRTRFSFASAANLLGLTAADLDEGKSQIAHGETVRETSVMVSYMAETIGIRDDMYIGKGHAYMKTVADAVEKGFLEGVLEQRPSIVNLQCDIDHPTQSMADLAHLVEHFGGVEALKGKKVAMSWAYSPSYGKPLSVPQGVIGLLPRFGMEVSLAHPEGYSLMPEVVEKAKALASEAGTSLRICSSMEEASRADVVYRERRRRPSRAPMSCTRRAGRPSLSWRSGPGWSKQATGSSSPSWRSAAWRTTRGSSPGSAPGP